MAQQQLLNPGSRFLASSGSTVPSSRNSRFVQICRASRGEHRLMLSPISLIQPKMATRLRSSSLSSVQSVKDESETLTLEAIRDSLIQQEDNIIFSLIERAQYKFNAPAYDSKRFGIPGSEGSLIEFLLKETESLHAKAGRYLSPDEHAFFPTNLPPPVTPPLEYPKVLHDAAKLININPTVWEMYFSNLLPSFVSDGDDNNYGSAAVCDVKCLQALSKRIHYGKFVAEAKYRESPQTFDPWIRAQDPAALMNLVTFEKVEATVLKRVERKAEVYGQEVDVNGAKPTPHYKVPPQLVARLYGEWVMPLTKDVQVQYLLRRLD